MEIAQEFELPFPAAAVWHCFHDTAGIVACLPGASLGGPPQGGHLPLLMTVKLGPIVASFAGDAQMHLDEEQRSGSVSGTGSDRKSGSRVKGQAQFAVHAAELPGGPTRVVVRVDYAIAGSLAQFSRGGIVQELAERLATAFRDNLKAKLEADQPDATRNPASIEDIGTATQPAPARATTAAAGAPATPPVPALDLGGWFWSLLLQRLRRLVGLAARP